MVFWSIRALISVYDWLVSRGDDISSDFQEAQRQEANSFLDPTLSRFTDVSALGDSSSVKQSACFLGATYIHTLPSPHHFNLCSSHAQSLLIPRYKILYMYTHTSPILPFPTISLHPLLLLSPYHPFLLISATSLTVALNPSPNRLRHLSLLNLFLFIPFLSWNLPLI